MLRSATVPSFFIIKERHSSTSKHPGAYFRTRPIMTRRSGSTPYPRQHLPTSVQGRGLKNSKFYPNCGVSGVYIPQIAEYKRHSQPQFLQNFEGFNCVVYAVVVCPLSESDCPSQITCKRFINVNVTFAAWLE